MKKIIITAALTAIIAFSFFGCSITGAATASVSGEESSISGLFSDIKDGISSAFDGISGGNENAKEEKEAALTQTERDTLCDMAVFTRVINTRGAVTKESVTEALFAYFCQNGDLTEAPASRNFEDGYLISLEIKADDLAAYVKDVFGAEIPSLYEEGSFAGGGIVSDGEKYTFYPAQSEISCEIISAMQYTDGSILVTTADTRTSSGAPMDMRVKKSDSPVGFSVVK